MIAALPSDGRVVPPAKLVRAGALRCACRDRATGALWLGADRGALCWYPERGEWRHLRLDDQPVRACGAGPQGAWLVAGGWLTQPDRHGAGLRRHRLQEAMGRPVEVDGLAADRGGIWMVVRSVDGLVPSLLRLPYHPPAFQRFHPRLVYAGGRVIAVAGDGERAWALGLRFVVELDENSVIRAGNAIGPDEPMLPRFCAEPAPAAATPEEELFGVLGELGANRWLRAHPRGLVGRNDTGLFCMPHGGQASCPQLPGRLDLFATDWLAVGAAMLVGTPVGLYVAERGRVRVLAPGQPVLALLDGDPPIAVTRDAVHVLTPEVLARAPEVAPDPAGFARELVRRAPDDLSPPRRALVARLIGLIGRADDLVLLVQLLEDPAAEVRAAACTALGRLSPPGAPALLARMMADPATPVQAAASAALRGG